MKIGIGYLRAAGRFTALLALALGTALVSLAPAQAQFVLGPASTPQAVTLPGSGDNFYKLTVGETGMQAVTYAALAAAGLPVETLDPTTFRLFEQGAEISRRVVDADNSVSFTPGDYIVFYGRSVWTEYTAANIYWLTYGGGPGTEMAPQPAAPNPALPQAAAFLETLHLEEDKVFVRAIPLTGVADRWHWLRYATACSSSTPAVVTITVATPGVAAGTYTATLTPRLRGFNKNDSTPLQHTAIFDVNGTVIGQANFTNQNEFTGSFAFDQALLQDGDNAVTLTAPCLITSDQGLINWYDVRYHRTYAAPAAGQFAFGVDAAAPVGVTLTGLAGADTDVYDITDPLHPRLLAGGAPDVTAAGSSLAFAHARSEPGRYIAAAPAQLLAPGDIAPDAPSTLRSPGEGADWIIITHPDFLPQAERLAAHRRASQMYRTAVALVQDVYDEFNGGLKDKEAIRAFLRHAYETWPAPAPRYVVLLGDGHFDPRYLLTSTTLVDYIPPYLAPVNPFDGIVAADNRYVAYDPVPPARNPAPFMHLGRLPANTLADAQAMVDKIIAYETAPAGDWNRDVLFVADNADQGGNFPLNSDKVAADGSVLPADFNRQKIYYSVNYADKAVATSAIIDAIDRGALFVNYHGHASVRDWSSEPLLALSDQAKMANAGKYPVFLPMTCLEGDFISPSFQSFGESVVRLAGKGAVASWSPTGKGIAQGHDVIYVAFYAAIFEHGITEIGPATTYAKQVMYGSTSLYKDLIDSYILFGDPAMPLALPSADLRVQKGVTPDAPWQPGQTITYTLAYGNTGMVTAAGVVLTDTLPAELIAAAWTASDAAVVALPGTTYAWGLPDLAPGATGVITLTAVLAPDTPPGTTITNTAVVATETYERPAHRLDNGSTAAGATPPELFLLGGRAFTDVEPYGSFNPPDDAPLPGVPVEVRDGDGAIVATVITDEEGLWSVALPAGVYTISVPFIFSGQHLGSDPEITVVLGAGGAGGSTTDFGYVAPTGLEIEYFLARWAAGGARIDWATRLELILEHFDVYRAADPYAEPQTRAKINADPIVPSAPPGDGAAYTLMDTGVQPGAPAYYWLMATTIDGALWIGPVAPTWKSTVRLPLVRK